MGNVLKRFVGQLRHHYYNCKTLISFGLRRNVYVFGAPYHSNVGDQAQTYCIQKWVEKNYPNHRLHIYETPAVKYNNYELLRIIKKCIKKSDVIFLHSGYHVTDLYMYEESMQRKVLETFPKHKIIFLPQTIYFESKEEEAKSASIYNNHKDVLLMCRDEVSFRTAAQIFPKCQRLLMPDIVTSLIGHYHYSSIRQGILLCMRNDKEALITKDALNGLCRSLAHIDTVSVTDTTIDTPATEISKNRRQILEAIWNNYSTYRVIITDRYHGTIFSLIASTPVIVLPSTDHKLRSGVKWFPKEFSPYVRYVEKIDEVPTAVASIYEEDYSYSLPPYFSVNYYDNLKRHIEEM